MAISTQSGAFRPTDHGNRCAYLRRLNHFVRCKFKIKRIKVFFDSSLMDRLWNHNNADLHEESQRGLSGCLSVNLVKTF